jgi:hypothetical protein
MLFFKVNLTLLVVYMYIVYHAILYEVLTFLVTAHEIAPSGWERGQKRHQQAGLFTYILCPGPG